MDLLVITLSITAITVYLYLKQLLILNALKPLNDDDYDVLCVIILKIPQNYIDDHYIQIDTQNAFILVKQREYRDEDVLNMADIDIGDIIDAKDQQNRWYQAIVINKYFERIYLHFIGWSSRWNEWISIGTRISTRFTFSDGPHCTHLIVRNSVVKEHEKTVIEKCRLTATDTFKTRFSLDFSSLIHELNHRDIVLVTLDSCSNGLDDTLVKVHRCVLSLWSPSFAILCKRDYGMKDCSSGIIKMATKDIQIIKLFSEWIYLSSSDRMEVENSDLYTLDLIQLMDLYTISEMHCVDELSFIVIQIMNIKMKNNANALLYDVLKIKKFILIRMNCINYQKSYKFNQLYTTFINALRNIELIDIKIVLLNCDNAELLDVGIDDEEKDDKFIDDDTKTDEICWVLTNICYSDTFDEWFIFVIKWIFIECSNEWFDVFAANDKWKCILNDWWVFLEKKNKNENIQISSKRIKNVKQNIHELYDRLDAQRLSNNTKSDLFDWILSLMIHQWDLILKKTI